MVEGFLYMYIYIYICCIYWVLFCLQALQTNSPCA